ncbi:glycoside hydrolase family 128 protein [Paxillus rubicundulus Ve08.2h10]|uniref:Glycoside hydrolase family 128 protein n=1 Tax=Paxillus rubicundulus Ve08.2h10 TaxID=930991 RepID=A0A0D0DIY5_9AGAM|nr:glycoside hydrolase family 128 protein [Paxillus rubicundulus Ve08.2h10]
MAALKFFNLLALASVAIVALSSAPVQVNALATDRSHAARHIHGHDVVAKRKRTDTTSGSNGRCKTRPTSSIPAPSPSAPPPAPTSVAPPAPTSAPPAPAPSSTPAPSPPSGDGKKWGLGWPNGDQTWLANFARPNVGYLYTWSPYLPTGIQELGLEGMPMLWGYDQVDDFQKLVVKGYANYVLGMNEPNEPSQSNMSPQDGVNLWMQYINPLQYEGYYLISPACTNDDAGLQWYQQFFSACQAAGCHVDAIAFHAYTTSAQAVIDYATQLHNTYNMDIWITEFADQNYSGTGGQATMDEVWAFAGTMISFVNNTPWIKAAFPFGVMGDLQGVNTDNALLGSNDYPTDLAYAYFG